ncbi:MAG: DNA-3-methyladenine glycosylase I [Alphaproteobacteria bacterium]|nr:DNA-3-methyladenine glycosylase I [Alphaproteobacteria bacterium]
MKTKPSCDWPSNDPMMIAYHDTEWGVALHDDTKIFEYMVLDAFQAGLSWKTILHKREHFRNAFHGFDYRKIARYGDKDFNRLMNDAGIIRNKAKINAAINNARCFLEIQREFGTFDRYIWQFTGGKTIHHNLSKLSEMPVSSAESDEMSRDLKSRGFKFVGTTICYAFMQAAGMVNDHLVKCFRYGELKKQDCHG